MNLNRRNYNFLDCWNEELKSDISTALKAEKRIVILPGHRPGKTSLVRSLRKNGYEAIEIWEAIANQVDLTADDAFIGLDDYGAVESEVTQ